MVAAIISTDQTGQYVIGANVHAALMPGVALVVEGSTAPGFLADHDSICTLTVLGSAVTYGSAAVIGQTSTGTMLAAVTVGEGGLLQSLTGFGIEMRRSGSRIDNDGAISGGNAGVRFAAGVTGAEVANSGTISSLLGDGIGVVGAAGGGTPGQFGFVNTGTIQGGADGVSVAFESLDLINHGDIIASGTGIDVTDDDALDNTLTLFNTGLVQGGTAAVVATGHADSVTNSGTLLGAVALGEGANLFDNSGMVSGAVSAGAGADAFTNTGVVSGAIGLGDGANSVTNLGRIEAGLSLGGGDDTVVSAGTIQGDVQLGDGTNSATFAGTILGNLAGGANPDLVEITGHLAGDVILGNGADSLGVNGRIAGNVDLGTGTDTLRLGASTQTTSGMLDGGSGDDTLISRIDVEDAFNFEFINLKGGSDLGVVADATATLIYGNRGNNDIDGGDGDDVIRARGGNDVVLGGLGADFIGGGRGADELVGGAGADTLSGGRGRDVFVYEAVTDSLRGEADRIRDFDRGRDKLDLTELVEGRISWLGEARFSGDGVAEARFRVHGESVQLRIDLEGDGRYDAQIILDDIARLTANDIFL